MEKINVDPLMIDYNKAVKKYQKAFGEKSISQIEPLIDPLQPSGPSTIEATKKLNRAVENGTPLPKYDPPRYIVY